MNGVCSRAHGVRGILPSMVVRPAALAALAAALLGCGMSQTRASDDEQQGGNGKRGSGGSAGSGGAPGPVCTPASEDLAPDEAGIHARIDGVMNHFVRSVRALVGLHEPDDALGFSTLAWTEPGVCGQVSLALVVTPGGDTLEVGTYACDATEPHVASGTNIVTVGGVIGASYQGGGCIIELSEVGTGAGAEVAGSFSGTLGRASGEPVDIEGQFRVTITE